MRFSNFAHAYHTDASAVGGDDGYGWPYETSSVKTPLGRGSHVGTHQSGSVYGEPNSTVILGRSTQTRVRATAASPYDALLVGVARVRDMHAAAPNVPIAPWLSPKYSMWDHTGSHDNCCWSWLSSDDGVNGRGDMWQENVMHTALSSGATDLLWWQPGANRPLGLGLQLLSSVLRELDQAIGTAAGALPEGSCTAATPLTADAAVALRAADDPYLLSGVSVRCADGVERRVYRLTPRCLDAQWCAVRPPSSSGGVRATLKLFSGFFVTPVADGCWWANQGNTSAAGFWIAAPCTVA